MVGVLGGFISSVVVKYQIGGSQSAIFLHRYSHLLRDNVVYFRLRGCSVEVGGHFFLGDCFVKQRYRINAKVSHGGVVTDAFVGGSHNDSNLHFFHLVGCAFVGLEQVRGISHVVAGIVYACFYCRVGVDVNGTYYRHLIATFSPQ